MRTLPPRAKPSRARTAGARTVSGDREGIRQWFQTYDPRISAPALKPAMAEIGNSVCAASLFRRSLQDNGHTEIRSTTNTGATEREGSGIGLHELGEEWSQRSAQPDGANRDLSARRIWPNRSLIACTTWLMPKRHAGGASTHPRDGRSPCFESATLGSNAGLPRTTGPWARS